MDDSGGSFADETIEIVAESVANASSELRKRRSTRIVQAVPLAVTGVDALGRPFVERTSSLIINCHGCRFQSKHYVLKNMWVTLEVPHSEAGQPPRTVRGRVAWIQRPRTVRQLFQVALELEIPGNVWGIAFPPEDWFPFPDSHEALPKLEQPLENVNLPSGETAPAVHAPVEDLPLTPAADNLMVFPSPSSATDASLQLARQVARLVADAKQQIQAATKEAASQAVSAERRLSFEQWEQKVAEVHAEIADQARQAVERLHQQSGEYSRAAHAAAAEALRDELPRWLAPQLEQLARDLAASLSHEAATQRSEHAQKLESTGEALRAVCRQAEETAARLRTEQERAEAQFVAKAEAATRALDEAGKKNEEAARAQNASLNTSANEIQQQVVAALAGGQTFWQGHLTQELQSAQARWSEVVEKTLAEAQDRSAAGFTERVSALVAQFQEDLARHAAVVKDAAAGAAAESEQRIVVLREGLQEQSRKLESALGRADEIRERVQRHAEQLESAQLQAVQGFQSQLDDVLSLHRNELHRRSESLFEDIHSRIHISFDESTKQSLDQFRQQVEGMVQPHISRAEEAINRLAGGQSQVDSALALQQERIHSSVDQAFAESLARFRENLGGVEQLLEKASQGVVGRNLAGLEGKVSDLKHQVVEELYKSAEWYEKKAQTQIQNQADRAIEQAAAQMRDKAGEISGVFASELDNSSRSFVGHTRMQMEEAVRDGFERARALFAEAADTTSAAFTDEIQRAGRHELDGFGEELRRSVDATRDRLNEMQADVTRRLAGEQEDFLRRFHTAMRGALDAGVVETKQKVQEGFAPLLATWKGMTQAHQEKLGDVYAQMGERAAEQHKTRLENISNQWLLATVASLDQQSRNIVSEIAASAEEKLREACTQVFAAVGESLQQRLREIAEGFNPPTGSGTRAKSANTGS